jgi:hypothetical protein
MAVFFSIFSDRNKYLSFLPELQENPQVNGDFSRYYAGRDPF